MPLGNQIPRNLPDLLNPMVWQGYIEAAPRPTDLIGFKYLPQKDVAAREIFWSLRRFSAQMAGFVAMGQESPVLPRGALIDQMYAEALEIRAKARLNEADVSILRYFGDNPVGTPQYSMEQAARRNIAEAGDEISESVDRRVEWMQINSLLGRLTVDVSEFSQVNFDIQYNVTTKTPTGGVMWDDHANSDPVLDIRTWLKDVYGYKYVTMIASKDVLFNLALNQKARASLYPFNVNSVSQAIGATEAENYFTKATGLQIEEYNSVYTTRTYTGAAFTEAEALYLDPKKIILLPDKPVGYTGTPPTPRKRWQSGKFGWTRTPENDPSLVESQLYEVGAGIVALPVLQYPERIIVAQVLT